MIWLYHQDIINKSLELVRVKVDKFLKINIQRTTELQNIPAVSMLNFKIKIAPNSNSI